MDKNLQNEIVVANNTLLGLFSSISHKSEVFKKYNKTELSILAFLAKNEKIKMSDISKEIRAIKSTTTMAVNNLADKKLIIRADDKNDRRIVYITLSNQGKKATQEYLNIFRDFAGLFIENLSTKEITTYIEITKKLAQLLSEQQTTK